MVTKQQNLRQEDEIMQLANTIACSTDLDDLLVQMLNLIIMTTQARTARVYLYDAATHGLTLKAIREAGERHASDDEDEMKPQPAPEPDDSALLLDLLMQGQAALIPDMLADPHWARSAAHVAHLVPRSLCCLPMQILDRPVGMVQICGMPERALSSLDTQECMLTRLIIDRLVTEIDKLRLLTEQRALLAAAEYREKRAEYHENQLQSLIDFISDITTTLERKELIRLIMSYAEKLLDVEATSFWLIDEEKGRLNLLVAAGDSSEIMQEVSVALGEGIIGHVVQSGERKVVNDVRAEPLFNQVIDLERGFVTRSILTVPMRAPRIQRGDLRGEIQETIIGGAQALNKRDGSPFTDDDVRCFETLARQAATAFQFSNLFEEDFTLFWGVVKAATSAIDLIDPYTRGHSERVSEFSVAIAEQLELPKEEIYRVRVGSMLHDVGKIGVDAQVLKKPGRLTENEFKEMQRHPMYGVTLFQKAGLSNLLYMELKALAQHHERLDGKGYPNGLQGDEISSIGRIVAVADTFDALTSDRPYRKALSVQEAFGILEKIAGAELDSACVNALMQARQQGKIRVQAERDEAG